MLGVAVPHGQKRLPEPSCHTFTLRDAREGGSTGKRGPWHHSAGRGEQSPLYTASVRAGSHACDWSTSVRIPPPPPASGLGTLSLKPVGGLVGRKIRLHRVSGGSWVVPEAMVGGGGGARPFQWLTEPWSRTAWGQVRSCRLLASSVTWAGP